MGLKIVFAGVTLILALLFLVLVDRGDRGPADSWFWRGASKDSFRRLIMKPDGTLKTYTKAVWAAFMVVWLCVILFLPS